MRSRKSNLNRRNATNTIGYFVLRLKIMFLLLLFQALYTIYHGSAFIGVENEMKHAESNASRAPNEALLFHCWATSPESTHHTRDAITKTTIPVVLSPVPEVEIAGALRVSDRDSPTIAFSMHLKKVPVCSMDERSRVNATDDLFISL